MKKAQSFSRGGLRDARMSSNSSTLRPRPRAREVVVVAMVMVVVVMVPLALTEASAERTAKRRKLATVESVECGCGADLSRDLLVEPTADKDCAPSKLRRPHELRGEGIQHYPLRAKVRRTSKGSEIHMSWRLSYIPHKKRSRLSEFHILFVTTVTRKNRKERENGQCFRVTGLRRVCKKKVICKAKYPKSRPRGLSLQVLYRYRKNQKVRRQLSSITALKSERSVVSYVLKASLARKSKRRGLKRSYRSGQPRQLKPKRRSRGWNPRHNRTNRQPEKQGPSGPVTCVAWVPTVRLSTQGHRVTVDISPVNPFASELDLALHYPGSSLQINPTRIPASVTTYTFTKVTNGIYVVSLRPIGPQCAHAQFIYSRTSVNVTGGNPEAEKPDSNNQQPPVSCPAWIPKVTLSSSGRSVTVRYSPPNPLASSLEIALQRPGSSLQLYPQHILNNVTTYTFENVEVGDYRMSIRALGDECRGATYIFSRDLVTVNDVVVPPEPPICSHWKPTFRARMTNHTSSWCLVEVDIDIPPNLAARKLEVALQEPDTEQIVKLHTIGLNQTSAVFNVTMGKNEMYKALVRPCGCTDCRDYELNREECFLPFTKANISASSHTTSPPPTITTTTTATTTTTTTNATTTTGKATATTIIGTPNMTWAATNTTNPAHIHSYLLLVLPVAVVTTAVVVVGVTLLLGKRCRRRTKGRPENAEAGSDEETKLKHPVPHAPSQKASLDSYLLAHQNSGTNCKHLSHCPSESDTLCAEDENTEVKSLLPPSPSQNPPPDSYLLDHDRKHHRRCFPQPPCLANRVLIVHECRGEHDKAILKLFLEVIKCLPHVQVKVDFACRRENARNVEEWVSCVLRSCSRVVVVLSESFLRVCRSYAGSRTLQVTSPSAYTDIAPLVMRTLAEEGFGRAIFVHFGIDDARELYHQLRDLWISPQNYRLMEKHPPASQPASLGALNEGRACEESRLNLRLCGPRSLHARNASAYSEECHNHVQDEYDEESSVFLNSADVCSACRSVSDGGRLPVAADARDLQGTSVACHPPPYSTLDPNPNAAACGSHAGRFNSGTNTSVLSWQARGTVVRPPASLVDTNRVPHAYTRTRHVSAPTKSNNVRPNRRLPADQGWYPNSRNPSAANCFSPNHNPCGCETSRMTVAFPAPSALGDCTGAESLSARMSTAITEHAPLSEHGCGTGLGHHADSSRHSSVSAGSGASHVCSCRRISTSEGGDSSSPSSAGGPISLRTREGLRQLLWLLCPDGDVIIPILSSSIVQTFLHALDDDVQPD